MAAVARYVMNEIYCHVIITNDNNNIMTNTLDGYNSRGIRRVWNAKMIMSFFFQIGINQCQIYTYKFAR